MTQSKRVHTFPETASTVKSYQFSPSSVSIWKFHTSRAWPARMGSHIRRASIGWREMPALSSLVSWSAPFGNASACGARASMPTERAAGGHGRGGVDRGRGGVDRARQVRQEGVVDADQPAVAVDVEVELTVVEGQPGVGLAQVEVGRAGDLGEDLVGDLIAGEVGLGEPEQVAVLLERRPCPPREASAPWESARSDSRCGSRPCARPRWRRRS